MRNKINMYLVTNGYMKQVLIVFIMIFISKKKSNYAKNNFMKIESIFIKISV